MGHNIEESHRRNKEKRKNSPEKKRKDYDYIEERYKKDMEIARQNSLNDKGGYEESEVRFRRKTADIRELEKEKWDLEEFGFGEGFLDYEEDKRDVLYSEKKQVGKKLNYDKVDFSKLDDLDFNTNTKSSKTNKDREGDLLDIEVSGRGGKQMDTIKEKVREDSDSDSDSSVEVEKDKENKKDKYDIDGNDLDMLF